MQYMLMYNDPLEWILNGLGASKLKILDFIDLTVKVGNITSRNNGFLKIICVFV